jgi:diadenosine tetraphosphate (Ap4A) HIT family hydrolase
MFLLDPKLNSGSFFVCDLKISRLLLKNDSNYPWFILVPREPDLVELSELEFSKQIEILREINLLSKILKENFNVDKINIGALGNMVRQLHIHIIGRFKNDVSFPKPVWEAVPSKPYEDKAAQDLINKVKALCEC